jgi:glycerophosphoryl diester phosphodiesterase
MKTAKNFSLPFVLLILMLALPGCPQEGGPEDEIVASHVIAHRGYWNTTGSAQNSIKALELADSIGVYGSEFDVHLTADNVAVINHDDYIQGVKIQTSNYADLKDLTLSNGEKIPTLESYLNRGKQLSIKLILEMKAHANTARDKEAAAIIVQMVNDKNLADRVEYITFSFEGGKEFALLAPENKVSFLGGTADPGQLKNAGFSGMAYDFSTMNSHKDWFAWAKDLGLTICVWTINNTADAGAMAALGADFITTDNPVAINNFFNE